MISLFATPNLIMLLIILCGRRKRWDTLHIKTGFCCVICRLALLQSRSSVLYWSVALFGNDAPIQDKTEFLESSTKPFVFLLKPASQTVPTLSHPLSLLYGKSLLTSNFSYLNIHPYTFLQSLKEHLTFPAWDVYLSWGPLCDCDTLE